jgi:hypothetical protein
MDAPLTLLAGAAGWSPRRQRKKGTTVYDETTLTLDEAKAGLTRLGQLISDLKHEQNTLLRDPETSMRVRSKRVLSEAGKFVYARLGEQLRSAEYDRETCRRAIARLDGHQLSAYATFDRGPRGCW